MSDIWPGLAAITDAHNLNVFGITVSYRRGAAAPVQIKGIFDADYEAVDTGRSDVAATQPMLFIGLSALASAPEEGDEITINGTLYAVEYPKLDGQGGVELMLRRK